MYVSLCWCEVVDCSFFLFQLHILNILENCPSIMTGKYRHKVVLKKLMEKTEKAAYKN
jgi:hypothetical protein